MPAERYFQHENFQEGNQVFIKDLEFHHLVNVMRNRIGNEIELINGQGQLATARITAIEKKKAIAEIQSVLQAPLPEKPLILVQAIPRLSKLEFILEKGTELGMTEVWLLPAAHSEKKDFSENQLERFQTILISAIKQCGRLFLPEIVIMPPLKQWKCFCLPAFFGDTRPAAPLFATEWQQSAVKEGSIFCVGPESGFTDEEMTSLQNLGAKGIKLNNNILRTETAAVAALSIMGYWQLEQTGF